MVNVRFRHVLRAEVTKLVTLRLPVVAALSTVLGSVVLSWVLTLLTTHAFAAGRPEDAAGLQPTDAFLVILHYAQIGVVLLGAWVFVQESDSAGIRSTFVAVPRRRTVLAAKAVVSGLAGIAVAVPAVVGSYAVRCAVLDCGPDTRIAPTTFEEVRILGGIALYWGLLSILAFALAATIRNGLVSIGALLALVLALSAYLLSVTPLARLLPDQAGAQLFQQPPSAPGDLGAMAGLLVLLAWLVALFVGGLISLHRWRV